MRSDAERNLNPRASSAEVATFANELANMVPNSQAPYVGASAFAHKAGYHVAGIMKDENAYQHIDPGLVGNQSRILVSELAGQRNLLMKLEEQGIDYPFSQTLRFVEVVEEVKQRNLLNILTTKN